MNRPFIAGYVDADAFMALEFDRVRLKRQIDELNGMLEECARTTYPKTLVDCLISDIRGLYELDGTVTLDQFQDLVSTFNSEFAAIHSP